MFEYKILPMGSSLNFEYELGDSLDGWDFSMRKVICKSDICCRESDMRYIIETTKTDAGTRVLPITEDVAQMFQAIIEDRNAPKSIDGYDIADFYFTMIMKCSLL